MMILLMSVLIIIMLVCDYDVDSTDEYYKDDEIGVVCSNIGHTIYIT